MIHMIELLMHVLFCFLYYALPVLAHLKHEIHVFALLSSQATESAPLVLLVYLHTIEIIMDTRLGI